jgi:hypothetical protein
MRVGKPNELTTQAFPLLTARISELELAQWFPVPFHHITDPQEAAEPSKAALIRLDEGDYFVLYWGELSKQLMLRIPSTTDPTRFLHALFREVPLPPRRILWKRQDAHLPRNVAAKRLAAATAKTATRNTKSSVRQRVDGKPVKK